MPGEENINSFNDTINPVLKDISEYLKVISNILNKKTFAELSQISVQEVDSLINYTYSFLNEHGYPFQELIDIFNNKIPVVNRIYIKNELHKKENSYHKIFLLLLFNYTEFFFKDYDQVLLSLKNEIDNYDEGIFTYAPILLLKKLLLINLVKRKLITEDISDEFCMLAHKLFATQSQHVFFELLCCKISTYHIGIEDVKETVDKIVYKCGYVEYFFEFLVSNNLSHQLPDEVVYSYINDMAFNGCKKSIEYKDKIYLFSELQKSLIKSNRSTSEYIAKLKTFVEYKYYNFKDALFNKIQEHFLEASKKTFETHFIKIIRFIKANEHENSENFLKYYPTYKTMIAYMKSNQLIYDNVAYEILVNFINTLYGVGYGNLMYKCLTNPKFYRSQKYKDIECFYDSLIFALSNLGHIPSQSYISGKYILNNNSEISVLNNQKMDNDLLHQLRLIQQGSSKEHSISIE